jgi:hypothetical protein
MSNEFKIKKGLIVKGEGGTVVDVQGESGQLFSVTDSLTGVLLSVNDITGIPILEVSSDDTVKMGPYSNPFVINAIGLLVGTNLVVDSNGNIKFDGTPTTTNQNRGIYWTAYDKEGTTDPSDAAYIRHTTNSGGLAGSVLEISSQNDADDGVNFLVNSTASGVRINGNAVLNAANFNSYSPTLTGGGASGTWGINITGNAASVTNGVYTTGDQTIGGVKTFSTRVNIHQSGTGGGQNIFTGVEAANSDGGRAQLILSSAYSDLVIASSQANNSHGSTLSFTTYNPSNAADYRKFVINQGNWGTRDSFLDFGWANAARANPHNYINGTDTVFTLDGSNKRVGIKNINPGVELDITGVGRASGDFRAPIFYDSNDTSFYVDPNAASKIRNLYVGDSGSSWSDPGGWGTVLWVSNVPHAIIRVENRTENRQAVMWSHVGQTPAVGSGGDYDFRIARNFSDRLTMESTRIYSHVYLEAAGSLRAPIFYDSDNTAFYVDPASTSVFNTLNIGRINITSGDIRSAAASGWTGDPGVEGKIQYHANRWYIVADQDSNRIVQFRRNATDVSHIDNSGVYHGNITGNAGTVGGLSATVFLRNDIYNSANVGLQVFRNIGTINGSWPDDQHTFSLENSDAGNIVLNFHRGGFTSNNLRYNGSSFTFDSVLIADTDMRAPIFYDSVNTAFYVDPASTSVLNGLTIANSTVSFTNTSQVIFDHNSDSTSIPFDMRKSGNSLNDGGDYGTLTLTRTNHNNGATSVGSNLYFQLKDSGGTLREYAGIGGRKTEAGAAGGQLHFYRYGRTELGYWNATGLFADSLYDRNNTAFYVDPASTSNLLNIIATDVRVRKNQSNNDYTTAAIWTESYGNTTTGVAFHISGVVGKFLEMRTDGVLYWENTQVVTNTGTWGINITGNAATATSANSIQGVLPGQIVYGGASSRRGVNQISNWNQSDFPDAAFLSSESASTNAPSTDFIYGVQTSFHRSGPDYRTQFVTSLYGDNVYWLRQLRDTAGWSSWVLVLHSGNFNSYAPTLTGGGASGTWGINITGNAGTVGGYAASQLWRSDGGVWNPSANITLNQTANGQEWSFDITRNGFTGGLWHVWDSALSTMLGVDPVTGKVSAPYNFVGNLEGNATSATTAGYATSAGSVGWADISGQRTLTRDDAGLQGDDGARSGFFETSSPTNYYRDASSWQFLIEARHSNDNNNYAMQIAGSFFDQNFWVRKTNNSATTSWTQLVTDNGGTWDINITGNAATTSQTTFSRVRTDGINRGIYGSISISGSESSYSGIDFTDASTTLMVRTSDGLSGMYRNNNTWIWYFDGSGSLTVGTVPWNSVSGKPNVVTGTGTSGQVSFWNGTTTQTGDNGLWWDNTNKRLGINTTSPTARLHVNGDVRIDSTTSGPEQVNNDRFSAVLTNENSNTLLGEPDTWLNININGTSYAIPAYIPFGVS